MADILINKFTTQIPRVGATPATPGFAESEGQDPVAPSGTPIQYGIGAGLSLDSLNQIQLGNDGAGVVDFSDLSQFPSGLNLNATVDQNETTLQFFLRGTINDLTGPSLALSAFESGTDYQYSATLGLDDYYLQFKIENGVTTAFFLDSINSKGLEYAADYSANWTDHSLVTKSWVLDQVSGSAHNPVTIGSPANGISISGTQVLTIGLASTSATGALSSTDWNTFNNKLNLTSPITDYTVGANTALTDTDTILQAFGKVQGQINSRISGTIASGQVAFGTGVNTVGGDSGFTYSSVNKTLIINTVEIGLGGGNISTNTRVGLSALSGNTTGSTNTAMGVFALSSNTIASNNTSFGSASLRHITSGSNNTAIGSNAGRFISTGVNLTTSNDSVFIGNNTRANADNETNQIVIGNSTFGGGSNTTTIGNTLTISTRLPAGSLWVNTTSGTNTLDVNGTARIRTISNLGTAATSVLVPSATGVISLRTLAEFASDAGLVTIAGTQTITGAKTFNNSLLVQSASNPVFRIATTDNIATVNFRNVFNEDAATIQMSTPATELALSTNVSNYDIRIQPHGTGRIFTPNIPFNAFSDANVVLTRRTSDNSIGRAALTGFTPTLIGAGLTFAYNLREGYAERLGRLIFIRIKVICVISGTPGAGSLIIDGLPVAANINLVQRVPCLQYENMGFTEAQAAGLSLEILANTTSGSIVATTGALALPTTGSNKTLLIQGFYISN